jgi:hypothetical protein
MRKLYSRPRRTATPPSDVDRPKKSMIAGVPVVRTPVLGRNYSDFLTWWNEVGRMAPGASQGWSIISGPGVMRGRTEMIAPEAWNSLPPTERELIKARAGSLPCGIFYD